MAAIHWYCTCLVRILTQLHAIARTHRHKRCGAIRCRLHGVATELWRSRQVLQCLTVEGRWLGLQHRQKTMSARVSWCDHARLEITHIHVSRNHTLYALLHEPFTMSEYLEMPQQLWTSRYSSLTPDYHRVPICGCQTNCGYSQVIWNGHLHV